ncbi:hypothetical protein [Burkholderia diffusa]|uniref:hypothetical protein n=1 Tax=Burkholderia diffusa TaxID=488732 RepID=UPI0018C70A13|nr:hypothetical protein [Burkholderia diffusa]
MARRLRSRSALLLSRIDRDRRRVDPHSVVNGFLLAVELQGHPQLDTHPGPPIVPDFLLFDSVPRVETPRMHRRKRATNVVAARDI